MNERSNQTGQMLAALLGWGPGKPSRSNVDLATAMST